MDSRDQAEYFALLRQQSALLEALQVVRCRLIELSPPVHNGQPYRIALRPDERGADPFDTTTLLDDIVVHDVPCFRAEQMDRAVWWVCCYLNDDTHDRITWDVRAKSRPLRIEWTAIEFPDVATYEHEVVARA